MTLFDELGIWSLGVLAMTLDIVFVMIAYKVMAPLFKMLFKMLWGDQVKMPLGEQARRNSGNINGSGSLGVEMATLPSSHTNCNKLELTGGGIQ